MSTNRKSTARIPALLSALVFALAVAPLMAAPEEGEEQSRLIKVSTNPDGTVNCAPRTMCHPLYNECC